MHLSHFQNAIKSLVIAAGVLTTGALVVPMLQDKAQAASERTPGSFVCSNNPAPECENPTREISGSFRCVNNPGPECGGTPSEEARNPEGWFCTMNQNVNCGNPIRFSVQDPETWAGYFSAGAAAGATEGQ